jgi:hypothetical protein
VRIFIYSLIALLAFTEARAASAAWTIAPPGTAKSKQIKSMPIMERPNRLLHVYGDAVRLANRKK